MVPNWEQMMMRGWGGHMGWGGPALMILGLLVLGLALWYVSGVTKSDGHSHLQASSPNGGSSSPLEILQLRYARGDISRDEYEVMRRDLQPPEG
jgi:putative membrane protein